MTAVRTRRRVAAAALIASLAAAAAVVAGGGDGDRSLGPTGEPVPPYERLGKTDERRYIGLPSSQRPSFVGRPQQP